MQSQLLKTFLIHLHPYMSLSLLLRLIHPYVLLFFICLSRVWLRFFKQLISLSFFDKIVSNFCLTTCFSSYYWLHWITTFYRSSLDTLLVNAHIINIFNVSKGNKVSLDILIESHRQMHYKGKQNAVLTMFFILILIYKHDSSKH